MDYKIGDKLICTGIFSTDDRVFDENDIYEVIEIATNHQTMTNYLYIKHQFSTSGSFLNAKLAARNSLVIYAEPILLSINYINTHFYCKRVDRKRKLEKINENTL